MKHVLHPEVEWIGRRGKDWLIFLPDRRAIRVTEAESRALMRATGSDETSTADGGLLHRFIELGIVRALETAAGR